MNDMTRTLKMIADCDEEVHFERHVKRELMRPHDLIIKSDALTSAQAARIAELEAAVAPTETQQMTMCADKHCPEYGTCYRSQAKPTHDQRFWAVSPREDNSCRFYAPMYFTNGLSALRENEQ
jgi:hypothetical protein